MKSASPRSPRISPGGQTTAAVQQIYDTTVGAETTDGSVLFEVTEAWSPSGAVVEVVDRFANALNFHGESYVPGQGLLMSHPDAR